MVAGYIVSGKNDGAAGQLRRRMASVASVNGEEIVQWMESGSPNHNFVNARTLLNCLRSGDALYVDDVASLGSTFKELVWVLSEAVRRGIRIYGANDGYDNSGIEDSGSYIQALEHLEKAYSVLRSQTTKAALKNKRNSGFKLGRPDGSCVKMRVLVRNSVLIKQALKNGESITSLCRKYDVSRSTFRKFMLNSRMKEQSGTPLRLTRTVQE